MEEWRYSLTQSYPRHYREVGGQPHVLVALRRGKSPTYPLDRRLSGPRVGLDAVSKRTPSLPLPRIEHRSSSP